MMGPLAPQEELMQPFVVAGRLFARGVGHSFPLNRRKKSRSILGSI